MVRSKVPFRVVSVSSDGKGFEFDTSAEGKAKSLHLIPVTFVAGGETGKVSHKIRLETDLGETTPAFAAYAGVAP